MLICGKNALALWIQQISTMQPSADEKFQQEVKKL